MLSTAAAFRCNCSEALCSREFFKRICVCPGCSPILSGGLTSAEKSAAAHSYVWQHGVRNACRVVSKCGRAGVQEVCIRVCTVATSQIMMRRVRQGGWREWWVARHRLFYQGPCVRQKTFSKFTIAQKVLWTKQCFVTWPCSS